jgi:hypothetical protein
MLPGFLLTLLAGFAEALQFWPNFFRERPAELAISFL